jgi:hypothetical protein
VLGVIRGTAGGVRSGNDSNGRRECDGGAPVMAEGKAMTVRQQISAT